ncbi:unnamed protein product [Urochloa humidicola]
MQRCLGLPMPLSTVGAAMAAAGSCPPQDGSNMPAGNKEGVGLKKTRKRPPRDPSSARTVCKVRSDAVAPVVLQASSVPSESMPWPTPLKLVAPPSRQWIQQPFCQMHRRCSVECQKVWMMSLF